MKTHSTFTAITFLLASGLSAQDVQKCCGSSNSTFLLGNISYAKHSQVLYLPTDLTNAQNGMIDRLYFRYGSTGEDIGNTLTDFTVRLGQTTATAYAPGYVFFTDLDTVLNTSELIIPPGVTGDWFSFPITPFQYDMGSTLILDIVIGTSGTTNFGTYGTTNTGRKIFADNLDATTGDATSTTWQDFGFDVGTTTAITTSHTSDLELVPLPGYDRWVLSWSGGKMTGGTVLLFDATGKMIRADRQLPGTGAYILDVSNCGTGIYLVQLRTEDGSVRTQRFFKP